MTEFDCIQYNRVCIDRVQQTYVSTTKIMDFQWPEHKSGGFGLFRTFDKRLDCRKCTTSVSGTQSRRYSKSNLHFDIILVVAVVEADIFNC